MSRVVLGRHWKAKGQAKHFVIAKKAKAERQEKAWRKMSKSKTS